MLDLVKNLAQCLPMFRRKNQVARLYESFPNDPVEFIEDSSVVATRRWHPDPSGVRAVLLMQHGFCSAPEVWDDWIEELGEPDDIAYSAPLLAGHGLFDFDETWNYGEEDWYSSLRIEYLSLKERYPDVPIVIIGHSLGGALATRLASEYNEKNLFLVAPFFFLKRMDEMQMKYLLPIIKNFFPTLCLPAGGTYIHAPERKKEGEILYALNNWKLAESLRNAGNIGIEAASKLAKDTNVFILQATHETALDPKDFERVYDLFDVDNKSMKEYENSGHVIPIDGSSQKAFAELMLFVDKAASKHSDQE